MYGAGDIRVETVPDADLFEPTDAGVRITRAGGAVGGVGVPQDASISLAKETFFDNITIGGGPVPVLPYDSRESRK